MGRATWIALLVIAAAVAVWFVARSERPAPPDTTPGARPGVTPHALPDEAPLLEGSRTKEGEAAREAPDPERVPVKEDAAVDPAGRVTGLVHDAAGGPQADVAVSIETIHRTEARGVTNAAGRFELAAGSTTHLLSAAVVARSGDQVATRSLYLGKEQDMVDVGTLVLAEGHFVDVVVRGPCEAVPPATLVAQSEASMRHGSLARSETDAEGRARLGPFPAGACRIFAFASGCGRGQALVTLPQERPSPIDIEVEEARHVVVTVVDGGTGEPVVGANLELSEHVRSPGRVRIQRYLPALDVAPTDLQGKTTIRGLSRSAQLHVAVHAAGRPTVTMQSHGLRVPRIPPEVTEVRIELPALRTVRWEITDKEGPIPPDGTQLTLRDGPQSRWVSLPEGARIEEGHIVVDSLLPTYIHGLAVTPDGRIARLFAKNDAELGTATSFRTARTIEVAATYADGKPVEGMWVSLRGPGNNAIGKPLQLDEAGQTTFRDLYGMKVTVYLSAVEAAWGGTPIGTVDLDQGSGRVEAQIARKREVLLTITLDGRPGIPPQLTASTWSGMSSITFSIEVVDRARGLARLHWQPSGPGASATLGLSAPGWVQTGEVRGLRLVDDGSGPIERTLAFLSGGTLNAHVLLPKNGRAQLVVQRWEEDKDEWVVDHGVRVNLGPDGRSQISPLRAGRHRLASSTGGGVSAAVEVRKGEATRLDFDLSKAGMATGLLELPAGADVNLARVRVDGRSFTGLHSERQTVWSNGTFRVMLSGTEEVVLRPEHPLLVPATEGGTVTLKTPRDGLRLKLVPGPAITAQLDPVPEAAERFAEPRLIAFQGPVTKVSEGRAVPIRIVDGQLRCGSLPAGTWTLWLDVRGFVPLTLPDVVVSDDGLDLGTLSLSKGSSFRLVCKVKEGQAPPRGSMWIQRLSEPAYTRGKNGSLGDLVVSGLGPGRYRVRASAHAGGAGSLNEVVEFDGTNTIERTIDLR